MLVWVGGWGIVAESQMSAERALGGGEYTGLHGRCSVCVWGGGEGKVLWLRCGHGIPLDAQLRPGT